jgi:hypothetical protein
VKTILANVDGQNLCVSTILHSKESHIQLCNLDLLSYETLGPSPDQFLKIRGGRANSLPQDGDDQCGQTSSFIACTSVPGEGFSSSGFMYPYANGQVIHEYLISSALLLIFADRIWQEGWGQHFCRLCQQNASQTRRLHSEMSANIFIASVTRLGIPLRPRSCRRVARV